METKFVNKTAFGDNERETIDKVKPTQVPQVTKGEQSPLQSLSC